MAVPNSTPNLTNEEQRVVFYATSEQPTIPSSVTTETPLEQLNLNWREADLPEHERTRHVHRLHPYLGKFIPQLVEVFLRKFFSRGQTVLDPFCGSGTTLVQASELGIHSIGYDISAFNVLLARAKTERYDLRLVKQEILDILEKVSTVAEPDGRQLELWETSGQYATNYLEAWFAPQTSLRSSFRVQRVQRD
jgi:SAM-dependent methyltransferase